MCQPSIAHDYSCVARADITRLGLSVHLASKPKGKTMKKNFAIALCAVCLCAAGFAAQKHAAGNSSKSSFDKFVEESNKAQTSNDGKWLEAHLADGYVEGTSFGTWVSKAQLLKDAKDRQTISTRRATSATCKHKSSEMLVLRVSKRAMTQ